MKQKKNKTPINNLKAGTFVKCNGSTLYIFRSITTYMEYPSLYDGIFIVERHPERTLNWTNLETYRSITRPKKKHVDNAIKLLKDHFKFKIIDNLSYIESLSILKNYNKCGIVVKD